MTGSIAAALPPRQHSARTPPALDRYAHRAVPPSDTLIRESEIPPQPQTTQEVIWEVSQYGPTVEPTDEQRQAAQSLIERSYASARAHGWYDVEKGMADGYAPMHRSVSHYANETYIRDGVLLDPDRPEFLMYYPTPKGLALAGYMFLVNTPRAHGPQVGGPLTIWHYHVWATDRCFLEGLLVVGDPEDGTCARGQMLPRSPEMIHVWLIDHPQGPFGTLMGIPSDVLTSRLERRFRERGF